MLSRRYGHASGAGGRWITVVPLGKTVQTPGGGPYLKTSDGRFVIFAARWRHGDRSYRRYTNHFRTVEYIDGATFMTGGANRDLYDGLSLEKAKAAAL